MTNLTTKQTDKTKQKGGTMSAKNIAEYRKWLEQTRPGLPPMPQDYIDSQIEAIELYLRWVQE